MRIVHFRVCCIQSSRFCPCAKIFSGTRDVRRGRAYAVKVKVQQWMSRRNSNAALKQVLVIVKCFDLSFEQENGAGNESAVHTAQYYTDRSEDSIVSFPGFDRTF
jgi:hypothetical protein